MKKSKKTIIIVILVIIILLVLLLRGCRKDVMVTFQSYGSSNEVRVSDDGTIDRIEDPKRDGYRFLGWYLDGELFDFDTKITEDITLVAKWEKIDYDEYTVKFIVDDEIVHSATVDEGSRVSQPSAPSKEGYRFLGWYYNGKLFNFNKKITKDMKLIARFEIDDSSYEETSSNISSGYIPSSGSISGRPAGGNSSSSSVQERVDVTPPNDFVPEVAVTTYSISITAQTTDDMTNASSLKYFYAINNGEFQNSPIFTNLKANTTYIISIRVVDEAGNERIVKQNIRTASIEKAEIVSISSKNPTVSDVVITVSRSDKFNSYYSFDGITWLEVINDTVTVSENSNVYICYGDQYGNYGESVFYQVNNIDRMSPDNYDPVITTTTNSISVSGQTTDNMTDSDDLKYYYQLDGGDYQETAVFENVSTGTHHLVIAVYDEAGNVLTIEKEVTVYAIEAPIISVSNTEITNESVTLTLENVNDEYQLQCKKEYDDDFKDCFLPLDIYENQTIVFRYTDGVNYSDEVVVTIDNIDYINPEVSFNSNDTEYHQEQNVSFVVTDNVQIASIAYAISTTDSFDNVSDWVNVDGTFGTEKVMNVMLDNKTGNYYVLVRVKDTAGNELKVSSPVVLLDNEDPVVHLDKSTASTNSISIKVDGSDQVSGVRGYYYSNDGGNTFSSLQSEGVYIFAGLKNNTEYSIVVKIEDNAGNQAISNPVTVTTNDFGVVSMTAGEDKWATKKTVSVSYQDVPGESYYYKTSNDGEWLNITQFPFEQVYVENGTFYFMVSDGVNQQDSQFEIKKIDPILPQINNISTSDLDYNQVRLHVDATDLGEDDERSEIAGYVYHCGNGIYSELTTESSYLCSNLTKETTYNMGVLVYDNAGNVSEKTISVTTLPKYEGIALPNTPEKLDGDYYFKADQTLDDYGFSVENEEWVNNEYTLDLGLSWDIGGFWVDHGTINYTIQFKNDTQLPMTLGRVETAIVNNPLNYIKNVSASLEKETVMPGESVSVTVSIDANFLLPIDGQSVRAIATYMFQGEEKQFIININY